MTSQASRSRAQTLLLATQEVVGWQAMDAGGCDAEWPMMYQEQPVSWNDSYVFEGKSVRQSRGWKLEMKTELKPFLAFAVLFTPLAIVVLLLPVLPIPWNILIAVISFAAYAMCLRGGRQDGPRTIHLSATYYVMALVALAAISVTALLARMLSEAGWWLTPLFAFEFALSIPLFLYVAVALILPEQ